jgi:hypothetical protein
MQIDIHLRDNDTGERVIYRDTSEWKGWQDQDDPSPERQIIFMFGDGNYACDCNRALFFEAAKTGSWSHVPRGECGNERYIIEKIVDRATGRIVYEDD